MSRKNTTLALRPARGMTAAQLHVVARNASAEAQKREVEALERALQHIHDAEELARNVGSTTYSDLGATEIRAAAVSLRGAIEHLETAAAMLKHGAR